MRPRSIAKVIGGDRCGPVSQISDREPLNRFEKMPWRGGLILQVTFALG